MKRSSGSHGRLKENGQERLDSTLFLQPRYGACTIVERESMTVIPEDHAKKPELRYDMGPFVGCPGSPPALGLKLPIKEFTSFADDS